LLITYFLKYYLNFYLIIYQRYSKIKKKGIIFRRNKMNLFAKNKLSQGIKVALLSSVIIAAPIKPNIAEATVPVIDPSAIARIATQTAQQAANFAKEMAVYAKQMAQEIMLAGQQMRNDLNRSMMEVGNITDVQTATHNIYMMAELKPDVEAACVMMTVNEYQADHNLMANEVTRNSMSNYVSRNMPRAGQDPRNSASGVPTPFEFRINMFEKLEELDERYASSSSDFTGSSGEEGSVYLNPSYMFIDNMTPEEFEIATVQKELLAGEPLPEFNMEITDSDAYRSEYVERSRLMMLRAFSVHAIQDIISARYTNPDRGLSKVGTMEEYLNSTVRNPDWVRRYTNTDQDVDRLTSSSQVQRQLAMLQGKRLELELMNYKQMEQIKGLLAVQALINMER
jgi:hypothetical protein